MKRIFTLCIVMCTMMTGFAQTDSTKGEAPDTIKIGGMVIIREKGSQPDKEDNSWKNVRIPKRKYNDRPSNISTNWVIFDFGFSNYNDETDYTSQEAQAFAPGSDKDWFTVKTGKSRNVNIWFFMQRLNVYKHIVNLKYGLGLELNNYFFEDTRIRFSEKPTSVTLGDDVHKNKLAADYLTVPMMLNFNFTPRREKGFGLSAGVSAGLLYSARQKIKEDGDIDKTKDDFDLKTWKLSYVAELLLGPVKLYGSYAMENMWDKGLDMTPWTVGFRISSW